MKWYALFSQTGGEIVRILNELGRSPDMIITNNCNEQKYKIHPAIREYTYQSSKLVVYGNHDTLMNYMRESSAFSNKVLITLHGYLRILPKDICEKFRIYNGHPGLITEYPELKGKDPQKRAWEGKYARVGTVIHRVIPEVDEGMIVFANAVDNTFQTEEELYNALQKLSLQAWVTVLKEHVL